LICIDLVREIRSPHSPERACEEFATALKAYGLSKVVTDRYGMEWPVEQFRRFGIAAEQSAEPKGTLYVELLPYLNSARVELLDNDRAVNQICSLERRTGRGREIIDHPPNGFDDVANALAGIVNICAKRGGYDPTWGVANEEDTQVNLEEERRRRFAKVGIPQGWSVSEYELRTRPPGGPYRELLESDPEAAIAHQRYIEGRIKELCDALGIDVKDRDRVL
jgi:hypothetical protein